MSDKVFIDTNIFGYAYTDGDIEKHEAARLLFKNSTDIFIISTQVISELYALLAKYKIKHDTIVSILSEIESLCEIKSVELNTVHNALIIRKRYNFNYWDSLILAAALEHDCRKIYTEDMQDKQVINNSLQIFNVLKHPLKF